MSHDKCTEVGASTVSGMREVRAFTDNVCESTLGLAAQFTLVKGFIL